MTPHPPPSRPASSRSAPSRLAPLRLAWAGPWNRRSAIAAFGARIVAEVAALGHAVEVFRTETGEAASLPALPAPGPVHAPFTLTAELMAGFFDGVIVNVGDNFGFHGAALPLLSRVPAVGVLHDASMDGFRDGWRGYAEAGGVLHGADMAAIEGGRDAPLELVASLPVGAVVHGRHYRARIEALCPGPVAAIPLAFDVADLPAPRPIGERLVAATIGHVNANKRVDQIIRAIGASPRLREAVHYLVIGDIHDAERARLTGLADRVGAPQPDFTGWVSDTTLHILLAGVDVIGCLRHPVIEGGSASLVLALRSGRPTLVSDQGSYAEVPDDLVLKCPPGHEAAHVLHHLETVLDDPRGAEAMGRRARAYAETVHSPGAYVAALLPFLERVARAAPAIMARRRIRRTLAGLGLPSDPASTAGAARGLDDLLRGAGKEMCHETGSERLRSA